MEGRRSYLFDLMQNLGSGELLYPGFMGEGVAVRGQATGER